MKTQIILNDDLKKRIKEYGKKTNMTMTTFIHIACEKYFDSMVLADRMKEVFIKAMEDAKNTTPKT